ncbi:RidA family protein [Vibrio cyclitrophicus]|nr:RidA family protein [Vibrio sp. OPT10]NOH44902.1 RidA family protein [Vibrio cyclitrophicus]OED88839.1 hypothetical protein OAQ_04495 [Vibrio cyclitrophicus ZF30]OEE05717.1 hypothetical protein OC5_10810 [Vibrio cyclitrophicus ZF264]OEE12102.1 hypothetical protein OC1_15040 [Vibrio cyclitrophicus ZF207]OEE24117.1 hypothetical protein OAM_16155 [Vibrio cyclitrophicus ZF14]OEE26548.1 hypothetical protein OAW_20030 [Vibrio cyclitrophicus ZF170]
MRNVIQLVIVYLTDFTNFYVFNEVWNSWFPEGCAPSRACAKAELANPELLVEKSFMAAAGEKFQ